MGKRLNLKKKRIFWEDSMQKIFLILGNSGDYVKGTLIKEIQSFIDKTGFIVSVTSNEKTGDFIIVVERPNAEPKNPLD